MYAVVETGGKQYRVEKGQTLLVDRLSGEAGETVALRAVMFRGDGDDVVLDGGDLEKVKVEAVIAEHLRGPKIDGFKYKPKKGYRRRFGHRSELTRLEVKDVRKLARKPAAKAAGSKSGGAASKTGARSGARKPAAKKEDTGGS